VAEAAVLSFGLANLQQKIGPRLTHDQIEQTMRETHSEEMFKPSACGTSGQRQARKATVVDFQILISDRELRSLVPRFESPIGNRESAI